MAEQIAAIDFQSVADLFRESGDAESIGQLAARAEPPRAIRRDAAENLFAATEAIQAGHSALAAGTVGAAMVAGGQGTRLGFDHPKGIVMAPDGSLYVSDKGNNRIQKFVYKGLGPVTTRDQGVLWPRSTK